MKTTAIRIRHRLAADPVDLICPDCGIVFSVPGGWYRELRAKGGPCFCPNGDPLAFRTEPRRQVPVCVEVSG